jgi:Ca2+-binding EF-hand superfamily protein
MVRNELNVPRSQLTEEQLQAIWRALDEDKSGLITCGEFGHFMRKGHAGCGEFGRSSGSTNPVLEQKKAGHASLREFLGRAQSERRARAESEEETLRQRAARRRAEEGKVPMTVRQTLLERNGNIANQVRRERDAQLSRFVLEDTDGVPPLAATAEELEAVSVLVNRQMDQSALYDSASRSWYRFFLHMDSDRSGNISYWELQDLIRTELKLSNRVLSEEQLKAIWRSLDADASGLITSGEFGRFMRIGAHVHKPDPNAVGKGKLALERKALYESSRKERDAMLQAWRNSVDAGSAAKRKKAAAHYQAAQKGLDFQPLQAWRSPRAYMF